MSLSVGFVRVLQREREQVPGWRAVLAARFSDKLEHWLSWAAAGVSTVGSCSLPG